MWVNDISWCIEIMLKFLTASPKKRTFKKIASSYAKGFFFFDFLATIPPMIYKQQNMAVNMLKFFRLTHIGEMFLPFKALIDCLMTNSI